MSERKTSKQSFRRRFVTTDLRKAGWLPPLLARMTLGVSFFVSGSGKLRHLSKDVAYFKRLGVPLPQWMAPFVAITEVSCGSLLLLGLFTRVAALPLIPVMGVAIATARRRDFHSFSELTGIYEFSYILLLSYLITNGAGAISSDQMIQRLRDARMEAKIHSSYAA